MKVKKNSSNFEAPDRLNRIVEGAKIVGDLITDSSIRIDGTIEGNITCAGKVLLGENGFVLGNLNCNEADVEGKIEGNITAEALLVLREKSKVDGNISTAKIEIHQGAVFLGTCSMGGMNSSAKNGGKKSVNNQPDIVY